MKIGKRFYTVKDGNVIIDLTRVVAVVIETPLSLLSFRVMLGGGSFIGVGYSSEEDCREGMNIFVAAWQDCLTQWATEQRGAKR